MRRLIAPCSLVALLSGCVTPSQASLSEPTLQQALPEALILPDADGTLVLADQHITPKDGELLRADLVLPEYERGTYFRAFTEFSGNQVSPIWFDDVSDILEFVPEPPRQISSFPGEDTLGKPGASIQHGSYMALKLKDGRSLAILPIAGPTSSTSFMFRDGKVQLVVSTHGDKPFSGDMPVYAVGYGANPQQAAQAAWDQALALPQLAGMVRLRGEKTYPEPLKYLGWASWEAYHENINEDLILRAFETLNESDVPFRFMLVDDGYLDAKDGQLVSFGVDREKFPNGWKPVTGLRNDKIKWFGIWRHMGGYMDGVSPEQTMGDLAPHLVEYDGKMLPRPTQEANTAFYDAMTGDAQRNGFDFQKVDFQSFHFKHYFGMPGINAPEAMHYAHTALENASLRYNVDLLDCIAQIGVNVFHTHNSAVMRNSIDYKLTRERANFTSAQAFLNSIWMSPVLTGDHDGYFTYHEGLSRRLAASRAISGGPIYLMDEPEKVDATWLLPTVYSDGEILGTRAPASAMPESVYQDSFEEPVAFRAMAPLNNGAVAIQAMNLTEDFPSVTGRITPADYTVANDMYLQDDGPRYAEDAALYAFDFYNQTGQLLSADGLSFAIPRDQDRFFTLVPITHGRAIVGLSAKFLSPQGYTIVSQDAGSVMLTIRDAGPFLVWTQNQKPVSEVLTFVEKGDGLWEAHVPENQVARSLKIAFEN